GRSILAERLEGDHPEENGADCDDPAEPAQVIGEAIGFSREDLALLLALAKRGALADDDLVQLVVEILDRVRLPGEVEIADPALALLLERCTRCARQLLAALVVDLLKLGDAPFLVDVGPDELGELLDLESGKLPIARIDIAAGLLVFVEHETGKSRFRARDVRADVANHERDVIGVAFGIEGAFAFVIGNR